MALTFTDGLVLFAVVLTALFTAILMVFKDKKVNNRVINVTMARKLLLTSIALGLIILYVELSTNFRAEYSVMYYVLITVMGALMVIPIIMSNANELTKLALPSIMVMHLDILFSELSASGISLGEGSEMVKAMYDLGRWYFQYAHAPTYNPFPTTAYVVVSLSRLLNMPWYSSTPWDIYYPIFIIAYDLTMYMLTLHLTKSRVASLVATLLVNTTPEVALTLNPYQYLSDMLMIIALTAFVKFVNNKETMSMAVAAITYTAAI
ncbi:MAG: hypothetical protein ACP5NQ_10195, partial [Vulcanisaeta sp.]